MKKVSAVIFSLVFFAALSFAVVGCKKAEEQKPAEAPAAAPAAPALRPLRRPRQLRPLRRPLRLLQPSSFGQSRRENRPAGLCPVRPVFFMGRRRFWASRAII
jgi:hypothetical protein